MADNLQLFTVKPRTGVYVKVHAANIHDMKSGCGVFEETSNKYPSIKVFCVDEGYRGTSVEYVEKELTRTDVT